MPFIKEFRLRDERTIQEVDFIAEYVQTSRNRSYLELMLPDRHRGATITPPLPLIREKLKSEIERVLWERFHGDEAYENLNSIVEDVWSWLHEFEAGNYEINPKLFSPTS